jgi:hypothetical protein
MRRADGRPACICPRPLEAPAKAGLEALPAKGRSAVHSAAHIRLQFEISMSATPDLKISSSARLAASRFVKPRQGIGRLCVGRLTNKTTRGSGSSCVCVASSCAGTALPARLVGFVRQSLALSSCGRLAARRRTPPAFPSWCCCPTTPRPSSLAGRNRGIRIC